MTDFGAALAHWMQVRGVGVRELHRRSGYSVGYVSQLRHGQRNPSPEAARDLDDALGARGELARAAVPPARRPPAGRRPEPWQARPPLPASG